MKKTNSFFVVMLFCLALLPITAKADQIIYWTNRDADLIEKTNVTTNTTTVLDHTLGPGDPDSLLFDLNGNIIYGLTNTINRGYPYAEIRMFNPNTNTDSLVTPLSGSFSTDLRDMALDPSGNSIVVSDIQNRELIRVDLATGNRTVLSPTSGRFSSFPAGVTYDSSGRLFLALYGQIDQIDPVTGAIINQGPYNGTFYDGLTYDPGTNMLYAATTTCLEVIDPNTLASSGCVGNFGELDGVEADGLGNIVVADLWYNQVLQYNIASGTQTFLFSAPGVDDVAPIIGRGSPPPSPTPEPATITLFLTGLGGLGFFRRRARC